MKMYYLQKYLRKLLALMTLCFLSTVVWAQDGGADVNLKITKEDTIWYTQPWVWILGGAVFLLLLVALLRGGGNND
jgi:hypothetical protein